MSSSTRTPARTPRTPKRRGGTRRPAHKLEHILELTRFKFEEEKKIQQGLITVRKTGDGPIGTKAQGFTAKPYKNIERYIIKKVLSVDDGDDDDGNDVRLRITQEDLQWEGYGDKFEFDGELYWLYYKEPTDNNEYNLLPVLPVDVDMLTNDVTITPTPNGHFVRLVHKKCVHIMATTDVLDKKGNHRSDLTVILNKFFLTKCDLYLPAGADLRWQEMKDESQALKEQYQQAGNVVVETAEDDGEDAPPLPASMFSRLEFENFQASYMKDNASFQAFMTKVEGDIQNLQDRMSTAEKGIEDATKKAESAIDIAKSVHQDYTDQFQQLRQEMSAPGPIRRALAWLLYWGIIIALIMVVWILCFKTYYIW